MARWVAVVRTFAPFVAGMGRMSYRKFLCISFIGGAFWVWSLVIAGHFLGQFVWVTHNLEWVILGIVAATIPIVVFETIRERRRHAVEMAEASVGVAAGGQS